MMKPLPADRARCGWGRWPNWRNRSRNCSGMLSDASPSVVVVSEVMDTTAGETRSTRSAKLNGALDSSMRGVVRGLWLAATRTGVPAVWMCRTGGRKPNAPSPTTTMAAALPITSTRPWRALGLNRCFKPERAERSGLSGLSVIRRLLEAVAITQPRNDIAVIPFWLISKWLNRRNFQGAGKTVPDQELAARRWARRTVIQAIAPAPASTRKGASHRSQVLGCTGGF